MEFTGYDNANLYFNDSSPMTYNFNLFLEFRIPLL